MRAKSRLCEIGSTNFSVCFLQKPMIFHMALKRYIRHRNKAWDTEPINATALAWQSVDVGLVYSLTTSADSNPK